MTIANQLTEPGRKLASQLTAAGSKVAAQIRAKRRDEDDTETAGAAVPRPGKPPRGGARAEVPAEVQA